VSLIVFLLIGLAGWRRRAETGSNAALVVAAVGVVAIVLAFFAVDTVRNDPWAFVAIVAIGLLSVVLDAVFRRPTARSSAVDITPTG
jgi:peptidoglycan/LPS O-acetylase OafA/YrhL